ARTAAHCSRVMGGRLDRKVVRHYWLNDSKPRKRYHNDSAGSSAKRKPGGCTPSVLVFSHWARLWVPSPCVSCKGGKRCRRYLIAPQNGMSSSLIGPVANSLSRLIRNRSWF